MAADSEREPGGDPRRDEVPAPPPDPADREAYTALPVSPDEGRLVAAPPVGTATPEAEARADQATEAEVARADRRAEGQFLIGKAARAGLSPIPLSPTQLAWRRLKKNPLAVGGGIVLIVLYTLALFAPFIAPYGAVGQDPKATFHPPMRVHFTPAPTVYTHRRTYDEYRNRIYTEVRSEPHRLRFFARGEPYRLFWLIPTNIHLFGAADGSRVYLLGADQFGSDILSRLLYAAQISLSVGLIGIAITFALGLLIGGASGYYGGIVDNVIMRVCEVIMSVPDFYLLLALAAALPPTLPPGLVYIMIIAILSLVAWAGMARVIRGMVLSVREREYVEAARALGVSDFRIILRHILPSTLTYAIVAATLSIPAYILGESGLSFLGLGIRDPMPSWGNMLTAANELSTLEHRTWLLAPGFLIFLTTLAFNFLGDGLRDALDPKSK